MDLSHARQLFQTGAIAQARVVPAPMRAGEYLLEFELISGASVCLCLDKTRDPRSFARWETAAKNAAKVGFHEVRVIFEDNGDRYGSNL